VDYYKADVVRRDQAGPDKGEPLVYHPPIPSVQSFEHHLPASHDSVVNLDFPEVNFDDWHVQEGNAPVRVLGIDAKQWAVLRWDLSKLKDSKAQGPALLELTTHSLASGGNYARGMGKDLGEEFPRVRVIEILGGDPNWAQESVTYDSLTQGASQYEQVFNTQMVIDLELAARRGEKAYFTLQRPVVQRMLEGKTKGLLIRPLGALSASVYASESGQANAPTLHLRAK
jgi:hypothetical protein